MPLVHSSSAPAFKQNVRTLMDEYKAGTSKHVTSPKQALAIAFSEKRRAKHANGGQVKGYDAGGATDPVNAVITALQTGSNQGGGAGSNPGMNTSSPSPASFAAAAPSPASSPQQVASAAAPSTPTVATNAGIGSGPGLQNAGVGMTPTVQTAPQAGQQVGGVMTMLEPGAMNRGGVPHMAMGGMQGLGQMPWYTKNEARSLVHSGPIMSAVPGRTDRHNMNLASGSYVMPAAAISHLGQSNTMAGMKVLTNMLGGGAPKIGQGMGAPKPPHMMGIPGDKGGARGEGNGNIVPVITAGGEYVISPAAVARLGDGDIKFGHRILDRWVQHLHKEAAKTIKNLPPPAKS